MQSGVVKYNDRRPPEQRTDELFFVVFQWRDPFFQVVKNVSRRLHVFYTILIMLFALY